MVSGRHLIYIFKPAQVREGITQGDPIGVSLPPENLPRVQWGSEIRTFEWSKRGWFSNSLDFKWDLKSGQMAAILYKTRTKMYGL